MAPAALFLAETSSGNFGEGMSLIVLGLAMALAGHLVHARSRAPDRRGRSRAGAVAIVLGYFILSGGVTAAAAHWMELRRAKATDPLDQTRFQERRIYNACQAYLSVRGRLPGTLEDLVPDYLADRRSLADPDHPEAGEIGYHYFGSGSTGLEPDSAVFLASKTGQAGRRAVIFFGGKSGFAPGATLPIIR